MPSAPQIDVEQGDKLGHFAAYGLLLFVFCQIYDQARTRLVYAAGFIAMGITLEYVQGMTDYRTFDPLDMLANSVGVFLGWGAAVALGVLRRNRG